MAGRFANLMGTVLGSFGIGRATLDASGLTANRAIVLPDKAGTVAMLDDLTSVTLSDTAPSSPAAGHIWADTATGTLYIYFNDGTSSQWVQFGGSSGGFTSSGGGMLGDNGSGGSGNWPTSGDRALMTQVVIAETITLTQFNMRIHTDSTGVGDRFKGLIYAADGTGGNPGTLLAVSSPTGPTTGGAELLTAAASGSVTAQNAWIGYVCDGGSGSGSSTDSGGTATNATIMLNSGETDYASPNDPAGNWPGSPGPYSNIPALWFDYTA